MQYANRRELPKDRAGRGGADKNWGTREEFSFFKEPMGMNKPKFDLKQ